MTKLRCELWRSERGVVRILRVDSRGDSERIQARNDFFEFDDEIFPPKVHSGFEQTERRFVSSVVCFVG